MERRQPGGSRDRTHPRNIAEFCEGATPATFPQPKGVACCHQNAVALTAALTRATADAWRENLNRFWDRVAS